VADGPRTLLGIDIGGTKVAAAVATDDGSVRSFGRIPTLVEQGPDATIGRIVELARSVLAEAGVTVDDLAGVGVGCGGPLDPVAGVIHDPPGLAGWHAIPLVARLEAAFGIPVHLDNDANAAALGEHRFGAGRGCTDVLYVTVSTGVGGGAVLGGRLHQGANASAAEIGHTSVDIHGRRCTCGRRGCLEAYASGTAIAARAREGLLSGRSSSLADVPGAPAAIRAEHVAFHAAAGDALAGEVWDEAIEVLGEGIANAINTFDPQVVVLGGGVTNAGEQLIGPVRRIATAGAFHPPGASVEVVLAALGERVGVLGAVAVALAAIDGPAGGAGAVAPHARATVGNDA
jgi:glucokinase